MLGVLLAGGLGTRLWPLTAGSSKQLLPIYNKPMIYYSLSSLMLAGTRHIVIVVTPRDSKQFRHLLGNGDEFGATFTYVEQDKPLGIPHALALVPRHLRDDNVILALGDNIFFGGNVGSALAGRAFEGAHAFGVRVNNPSDFGVVTLGEDGTPERLEEKPLAPKSDLAVPGLYYMDSSCFERIERLQPSSRGEFEIVDLLRSYLFEGRLSVQVLPRGTAWLDTGRADSLARASQFVEAVEANQGLLIGSPHEVAWRQKWISTDKLRDIASSYPNSDYGRKLAKLSTDR